MADYISRLVKAYSYLAAHPQAVIQTVYEGQYGLKPARAAVRLGRSSARPRSSRCPAPCSHPQQNLANLYLAAGAIPSTREREQGVRPPLQLARHGGARLMTVSAPRTWPSSPPRRAASPRPASAGDPARPGAAPHRRATGAVRRRRGARRGRRRLIGVVLLVALWEVASLAGWIRPEELAAPTTVISTGAHLVANGTLPSALWASLQRVFWGLAIGVPVGALLALAAGLSSDGRAPDRRQRPDAAVRPDHRAGVALRPLARRRRDRQDLHDHARGHVPRSTSTPSPPSARSIRATASWPTWSG